MGFVGAVPSEPTIDAGRFMRKPPERAPSVKNHFTEVLPPLRSQLWQILSASFSSATITIVVGCGSSARMSVTTLSACAVLVVGGGSRLAGNGTRSVTTPPRLGFLKA